MKVARYMGAGQVAIVDESIPACPPGGLLVKVLASGLCSGELMDWYMDRKIPHVLGHELAGEVIESQDPRFPVGSRVAPHHHGPCLRCDLCLRGAYVHCPQWKRTKLIPGGLCEFVAVSAENLTDTRLVDDLDPRDAALMEPLACVAKSVRRAGEFRRPAVLGLGVMGLMHALVTGAVGYDPSPARRAWATKQGVEARDLDAIEKADAIFVCPGASEAVRMALEMAAPDAAVVLFSPLGPVRTGQSNRSPRIEASPLTPLPPLPAGARGGEYELPFDQAYFADLRLIFSYSCGPEDTRVALEWIRAGKVRAGHVVERFIGMEDLPEAYLQMKRGEIVKPMVEFS